MQNFLHRVLPHIPHTKKCPLKFSVLRLKNILIFPYWSIQVIMYLKDYTFKHSEIPTLEFVPNANADRKGQA